MANFLNIFGGGTAESGPCIIVKATAGSTITCTNGSTILEGVADASNIKEFYLTKRGTWTVTSGTHTKTVEVNENKDYTVNFLGTIMGVSRDITSTSPIFTRTDEAVGKSATASIGTSAGSSDFDTMPIFKDITRETLASGDVMVKIPKFWYRRYRDGNTEYLKICDNEADGFVLHPAFLRNGVTYEHIYVGAYKTSSGHVSKTGKAPLENLTRANFRTNARNKGTGWGIIDLAARMAVNMLMCIEFATLDGQTAIGAGYTASSHSAAINTGSCDGVPNLTGRPAGTSDNVDVVWRGIEGWWGNVWEWTDGLNWNGGQYYVSNTPESYADDTASGYTALSYSGPTSWSGSYIQTMGLDESNPWAILPSAAGGGSSSTYFCDGVWSNTGWRVFACGGGWEHAGVCGLWASDLNFASSSAGTGIGSRLLYLSLT